MPRLPLISSARFCKILKKLGCKLDRIEGGHHIFVRDDLLRPLVVPTRKQLPVFIILNNLKTLGISRDEFIAEL